MLHGTSPAALIPLATVSHAACRSYKTYNDEPAAVQYDGPANYTQIGAPQCNVQQPAQINYTMQRCCCNIRAGRFIKLEALPLVVEFNDENQQVVGGFSSSAAVLACLLAWAVRPVVLLFRFVCLRSFVHACNCGHSTAPHTVPFRLVGLVTTG